MTLNLRVQNNTEVLNGFDYRFFYTQTETYQQPFKITVNPNSLGGGYLEDEYITDPNFGGSIRMALKGINIITQGDNIDASTYDLSRIYLIFDDRIGFDNNILDTSTNRWETEDDTTKLNDIFSSGTNKRQRENIINQFTARFDSDKVPIDDVRMIDDKMKHRTLFDNIVTKYNENLAKFSNPPKYRYGHTATYVSNYSSLVEVDEYPTINPNYISQIWMIGGLKIKDNYDGIEDDATNEIYVLNTVSNVWEQKNIRNRIEIYDIYNTDSDKNEIQFIIGNMVDFQNNMTVNAYETNGIEIIEYKEGQSVSGTITKQTLSTNLYGTDILKISNINIGNQLESQVDPNKILDYEIRETFYKLNITDVATKENNYTINFFMDNVNEKKSNSLQYILTPETIDEDTLTGDGNKYLVTYGNYKNLSLIDTTPNIGTNMVTQSYIYIEKYINVEFGGINESPTKINILKIYSIKSHYIYWEIY